MRLRRQLDLGKLQTFSNCKLRSRYQSSGIVLEGEQHRIPRVAGLENAAAEDVEALVVKGCYEKAVEAADRGLAVDPHHTACVSSKWSALCELGQYKLALKLVQDSGVADHHLLKASRELVEQSSSGKYDLSEYYLSLGRRLRDDYAELDVPKLAEYIGPIEVRNAAGKGRGIFLTKSVFKGKLLMVSNAVSLLLGPHEQDEASSRLRSEVVKVCKASPTKLAQLLCLKNQALNPSDAEIEAAIQRTMKNAPEHMKEYMRKNLRETLNRKKGGSSVVVDEVPSMDLFRPNDWEALLRACREQRRKVLHAEAADDDEEVQREVENRMILERSLTDDCEPLDDVPYNGMWVLPSLINHSCMGNVSTHRIGRAFLVLAARDMQAGTELERSYGGCYRATHRVTAFVCSCRRCTLEPKLEKLSTTSTGYIHALEVEREIARLGSSWTEEQKGFVRTSYIERYVLQRGQLPSEVAEAAMRALHETVPGFSSNLQLMALLCEVAATPNARSLLEQECVARVGRQAPDVLQAVIDDARRKYYA